MDISEGTERKGPEHQMLRIQCGLEPLKLEVQAGGTKHAELIKYGNLGPKTKVSGGPSIYISLIIEETWSHTTQAGSNW